MGKDCWDFGLTEKVYVETSVHGNRSGELDQYFLERSGVGEWCGASIRHLN